MKKLILSLALLCALCCSVFAERIKITGGGQAFNTQIERTELSAQMLDRMPLELDMTKLYSFLIYGDRAIDVSGVKGFRGDLKKGDIAYCTYGYLIILTEDQPAGQSSRFVKVGQIDNADISKLNAISRGGKIWIERVE